MSIKLEALIIMNPRPLLEDINSAIITPSTAFTINNTNIVFSEAPDATDTVDFVLVLGETVSIGTPSDGTVAAAQVHSTLDLSSKTVTLPNTSVTNAQLQNSSITINGAAVALGGSTTITTIARPTITTSSAVIAPSSDASFTLAGTNFVSVPIVELISSTGAITTTDFGGTSTTATLYNFTLRITDAEGQTADRAFSISSNFGATGGGQFN